MVEFSGFCFADQTLHTSISSDRSVKQGGRFLYLLNNMRKRMTCDRFSILAHPAAV